MDCLIHARLPVPLKQKAVPLLPLTIFFLTKYHTLHTDIAEDLSILLIWKTRFQKSHPHMPPTKPFRFLFDIVSQARTARHSSLSTSLRYLFCSYLHRYYSGLRLPALRLSFFFWLADILFIYTL